jgi:hypothetical protein
VLKSVVELLERKKKSCYFYGYVNAIVVIKNYFCVFILGKWIAFTVHIHSWVQHVWLCSFCMNEKMKKKTRKKNCITIWDSKSSFFSLINMKTCSTYTCVCSQRTERLFACFILQEKCFFFWSAPFIVLSTFSALFLSILVLYSFMGSLVSDV